MDIFVPFRSGGSFCCFLCFHQLLSTGRRRRKTWLFGSELPGASRPLTLSHFTRGGRRQCSTPGPGTRRGGIRHGRPASQPDRKTAILLFDLACGGCVAGVCGHIDVIFSLGKKSCDPQQISSSDKRQWICV